MAQSRGGACFCTRGAMQGYDGYYLILALAKTLSDWCQPGRRDTRRESPAGAGAGRGASHKTASLFTQLSRHGAPMTYTDLLEPVFIHKSFLISASMWLENS